MCEKLANISFGNITKQTIEEIWNQNEVDKFLETCRIDQKCLNCNVKDYCFRCNENSFLETAF
ncbi:MAG: SPASM domain-containing protein [Halanaerobiales bacterium]|nr:SPASM domain-containing protein [Halanaerobiales bacterium]